MPQCTIIGYKKAHSWSKSNGQLKWTLQLTQECESLQPLTFEFRHSCPATSHYKYNLKEWQWYKTRTKLYLICSPFVLNKLIISHSSSDGDKLRAEVHNRKARNCRGEWTNVLNWGSYKWDRGDSRNMPDVTALSREGSVGISLLPMFSC